MCDQRPPETVSRRTALAAFGVAGVGLALTAPSIGAIAQETSSTMAKHPMVGVWLALVPGAPDAPPVANVTINTVDGLVVNMAPVARSGPQGVTIASGGAGVWESTGERSWHFTVVQALSNPDGVYLGTLTIDGFPTVSEDGMSFIDDSPESHATIRDPAGNVVSVIEGARVAQPVTGTRIVTGSPGFPESTPVAVRTTKVWSLP